MSWDWEQQRRDERLASDIGQEVGESVGEQLGEHLGKLSEDIVGAIGTQSQIQAYMHEERLWFDTLSQEQKIEYLQQKELEQQRQIQQARKIQVIQNETLQKQQAAAREEFLSGDLNWWQSIFSVFIRPLLGLIGASLLVAVLAAIPGVNEVLGAYNFGIWLIFTVSIFLFSKPIKRVIVGLFTKVNKSLRAAENRKADEEYQRLMEVRKKFQ